MQGKIGEKRSLCVINEHSEFVFNTAAATQIVFQTCKLQKSVSTPQLLFRHKNPREAPSPANAR